MTSMAYELYEFRSGHDLPLGVGGGSGKHKIYTIPKYKFTQTMKVVLFELKGSLHIMFSFLFCNELFLCSLLKTTEK
jgi:hypothetical protein